MTPIGIELQQARDEMSRLITNWQTLLDAMPEMVILLSGDCVVQYLNRSAKECFGNLCANDSCEDLRRIVQECGLFSENADDVFPARRELSEGMVNSVSVEYSLAPFSGYRGERLLMVVMRDITLRRQHEQELNNFHSNIEEILAVKIAELQESEDMRRRLSRELNSLKSGLGFQHKADKMIGSSRIMRDLRDMIHQVAKVDATVLITGESGTGKELVANLVRATSNRADKPFLKINCNAINDSLLESDLFGYEKGAFTGASSQRKGKFESVDGGTIFLDEIGDISPRMQASLLRVLQNGEILRVGGTEPIKVDVRVIAATHVDLAAAVQKNSFRLDLFYRLNIINIDIPPLRKRKEDIVELVSYFVKRYREAFKKDIDFVPQSVIRRILAHNWPGNIRELENLIQRAVLMAHGKMITEDDLFFDLYPGDDGKNGQQIDVSEKLGKKPLKGILSEFEGEVISQALRKYEGNVSRAASKLKIGKTALYDKMKRHRISAKVIKKGF